MCGSYARFEVLPTDAQKLLANLVARANRVKLTQLIVPRKTKGTNSTTASSEATIDKIAPRRRPSTSTKKIKASGKKSVSTGVSKSRRPVRLPRTTELPDEEIRLRAYFISERRLRLALPGDTDSDWLEAKRQLLSEVGPR